MGIDNRGAREDCEVKKTIRDVQWTGKAALVRVDFNVPFELGTNRISDDIRIREALPTITYLLSNGASVILCTHLGRPDGRASETLSLGPIADRLAELLGQPVPYIRDAPGADAKAAARSLAAGEVMLLENIRFLPPAAAASPPTHQYGSCARLGVT